MADHNICGRCEDPIDLSDCITNDGILYCGPCSHFVTYWSEDEEEEEEEEGISYLPDNWKDLTLDQRIAWAFSNSK